MTLYKDPADRRDYPLSWTELGADVIVDSAWEAPGLTIEGGGFAPSFTDDSATVWLSGGTAGTIYTVTNHIETEAGRELEQSFDLVVNELVVGAYYKDPGDVIDFALDWSGHFVGNLLGDTIAASIWAADPGITIGNGSNGAPAPTNTTTTATLWLLGGTAGTAYEAANQITSAGGRILRRKLRIQAEQL